MTAKNFVATQTPYTFSTLPSGGVGQMVYCSDCQKWTDPCSGGGGGTFAFLYNTAAPTWRCL
jgi:hypothetical protein